LVTTIVLPLLIVAGCATSGSSTPTTMSIHHDKGACVGPETETCLPTYWNFATSTSFLTKTVWQSHLLGKRKIVASLGHAQIIFVAPGLDPKGTCEIIENLYSSVPAPELHLLPIWGIFYLPGCLVGQMP